MEQGKDTEIESSKTDTVELSNNEIQEKTPEQCSEEDCAKELEESNRLVLEYLDHLQRLQAEFENYKKRVEREKQDIIEYATVSLISELIDVMENLERGIDSIKESEDNNSIRKGMEMVYDQLKDILESKGLTPIEAVGQKFNPYYHEAMMKNPSDEFPHNTVIEEFQRGYKVKDRVVRFSKVMVSVNENSSKINTSL